MGLSVGEEGHVYFAGAYSLVSAQNFDLLAVVAEGDVLSHEIDLGYDGEELGGGDVELSLYSDGYLFLVLVYFIL